MENLTIGDKLRVLNKVRKVDVLIPPRKVPTSQILAHNIPLIVKY